MQRIHPLGREILNDVRPVAAGAEGEPPAALLRHLAAWRRRNPALEVATT